MGTYELVDGLPKKIEPEFFLRKFGETFPDLLPLAKEELVEELIDDIYTMFHGVNFLWDTHKEQVWYDKTRMCYSLLLAWYITDTFPLLAVGVPSMGGMPIKQKSIGGVKIVFGNPDADGASGLKHYKDQLAQLKTNPFGYKAYTMINSAVALVKIRGRKRNI